MKNNNPQESYIYSKHFARGICIMIHVMKCKIRVYPSLYMDNSPKQYYNNIGNILSNNSNNLLDYQIRTNVIQELSYSY